MTKLFKSRNVFYYWFVLRSMKDITDTDELYMFI